MLSWRHVVVIVVVMRVIVMVAFEVYLGDSVVLEVLMSVLLKQPSCLIGQGEVCLVLGDEGVGARCSVMVCRCILASMAVVLQLCCVGWVS